MLFRLLLASHNQIPAAKPYNYTVMAARIRFCFAIRSCFSRFALKKNAVGECCEIVI